MIQAAALTRRLVPCTVRDYTPADHDACVAVYQSNTGVAYTEGVLEECLRFLDEGTSYQLVLEREGRVVGCGGLELRGEGPYAHLIFGCIHRDFQRRGLGSTLLAARLSLIEHAGESYALQLEAGADVAPFFAQAGFVVAQVRVNRFGPGQDAGMLVLQIEPAEIDALRRDLAAAGVVVQIEEVLEDDIPEGLDDE